MKVSKVHSIAPMVVAAALAVVAVGCDSDEFEGEFEEEVVQLDEIERGFELLDIIPLEEGGRLEFGRSTAGGIVLVEDVAVGERSPLQTLIINREATPLEMYLALAPERMPPQALLDDHEATALKKGLSIEPRVFPYRESGDQFRDAWTHSMLADCDDGDDRDWQDNAADLLGLDRTSIHRTNSYGSSSVSMLTDSVLAHICSDGPSGNKQFRVRMSGAPGPSCGSGVGHYDYTTTVVPEHRVFYMSLNNDEACGYRASASNPIGQTRLPTYMIGIAAD